jgi:type IV pilus secretin PilQ/predicted competence protein
MSKRHYSFVLVLLLFSFFMPQFLSAEDLVGLKNLSWEEQKDKTRIILETTQPLQYNVTASQTNSEVQVELVNLDLRNLPQELFINTPEVVSLQTFPQTDSQKSRIVVKLTSFRPHEVLADGNKLYIDIQNGSIPAAPTATAEKPQQTAAPAPVQPAPEPAPTVAAVQEKKAEEPAKPAKPEKPATVQPATEAVPATEIQDVQISPVGSDKVDVLLIGDGAMNYDVFELTNPERLVIDVKSVSVVPGLGSRQSSAQQILSKVRVAQYQTTPKVVRAVIDLNKKVPYSVTQEGVHLRIHLGSNDSPQAKTDSNTSQAETEVQPVTEAPEPVQPAAATPVQAKAEEPKIAKADPAPVNDKEFFTFQPDTKLFAQETAPIPAPPSKPPATESTGQGGVGNLQDKAAAGAEKQYTGEPFSFDFKDIDIKDLFRFIADISGLNVILDPSVRGSVTLKLTEVPWDQALDLITKNQGLGYTIEGNVIRIAPLSKIEAEEKQRRLVEEQQFLSAPLVTKIRPLSYAKAAETDVIVKRLLTKKGSSIVDRRTNTLIITDIDTNIDSVMNLIDTLDSRTTQVVIETRIVETTKNFAQAFGIQWGFRGIVDPSFGNNTTLQFPNNVLVAGNALKPTSGITGNPLTGYAVNLPTSQAPNSAVLLSAGNILDTFRLDVALMALENSGQGRILSSPKVATQNNTRAEIVQGTQIPVQTIANNTITTTYVQASLRMSVLPQITAEGTVILDVEIENNRPNISILGIGGTPAIDTESARTTLLVDDGGTTVIGGIFTATESYQQGRTPVLHRIPLLGWLFKNTNITRENRELLIFLTPRIIR